MAGLLGQQPQAGLLRAYPERAQLGPVRSALTFLLGGTEGLENERTRPQREAAARMRYEAQNRLFGIFGGGEPAVTPAAPALAPTALAPIAGSPLSEPAPASLAPAAPPPCRLPSLRDAAPALAAAQLAGIEGTDGLASLLKDIGPDIDVVNGVGYDKNDPGNVGRRIGVNLSNVNGFQLDPNDPSNNGRYLPDLNPGEEPVYDQNGRVVGVRNLDGAIAALAGRTRAVQDATNASEASYAGAIAGAEAAAKSPYEVETVQGPTGPITMSRAQLLGAGPIAGVDTTTINARETRNEEDFDAAEGAESIAGRFANIRQQLQGGTFDLNPVAVAQYELNLARGGDDPAAVAYANYRSTIQQAVNDSLRLNKGVQTEGDATRESQAILRNINNRAYVQERLQALEGINARGAAQRRQRIDRRGGQGGVVTVSSPEQARALPPGTRFRTPDGQERVRR